MQNREDQKASKEYRIHRAKSSFPHALPCHGKQDLTRWRMLVSNLPANLPLPRAPYPLPLPLDVPCPPHS